MSFLLNVFIVSTVFQNVWLKLCPEISHIPSNYELVSFMYEDSCYYAFRYWGSNWQTSMGKALCLSYGMLREFNHLEDIEFMKFQSSQLGALGSYFQLSVGWEATNYKFGNVDLMGIRTDSSEHLAMWPIINVTANHRTFFNTYNAPISTESGCLVLVEKYYGGPWRYHFHPCQYSAEGFLCQSSDICSTESYFYKGICYHFFSDIILKAEAKLKCLQMNMTLAEDGLLDVELLNRFGKLPWTSWGGVHVGINLNRDNPSPQLGEFYSDSNVSFNFEYYRNQRADINIFVDTLEPAEEYPDEHPYAVFYIEQHTPTLLIYDSNFYTVGVICERPAVKEPVEIERMDYGPQSYCLMEFDVVHNLEMYRNSLEFQALVNQSFTIIRFGNLYFSTLDIINICPPIQNLEIENHLQKLFYHGMYLSEESHRFYTNIVLSSSAIAMLSTIPNILVIIMAVYQKFPSLRIVLTLALIDGSYCFVRGGFRFIETFILHNPDYHYHVRELSNKFLLLCKINNFCRITYIFSSSWLLLLLIMDLCMTFKGKSVVRFATTIRKCCTGLVLASSLVIGTLYAVRTEYFTWSRGNGFLYSLGFQCTSGLHSREKEMGSLPYFRFEKFTVYSQNSWKTANDIDLVLFYIFPYSLCVCTLVVKIVNILTNKIQKCFAEKQDEYALTTNDQFALINVFVVISTIFCGFPKILANIYTSQLIFKGYDFGNEKYVRLGYKASWYSNEDITTDTRLLLLTCDDLYMVKGMITPMILILGSILRKFTFSKIGRLTK